MEIAEHLNIIYTKFSAIISHTSLPQLFFEKILFERLIKVQKFFHTI